MLGYTSHSQTMLKNHSRELLKADPASVSIQYRIPSGPGDFFGRLDSFVRTALSSALLKAMSSAGSLGCISNVGIAACI